MKLNDGFRSEEVRTLPDKRGYRHPAKFYLDLQTVKRGYGKQLAKALIKLEKDKVDVVVADRWYLVAFDDIIQVFGDRLARLGWTGEEDFGTEKVNES